MTEREIQKLVVEWFRTTYKDKGEIICVPNEVTNYTGAEEIFFYTVNFGFFQNRHRSLVFYNMNGHIIYKHIFPDGKSYIGQCRGETITDAERHRWMKGEGYKGQKVYNAIKKYGWDNIQHEILVVAYSQEEANEKEIYYIEKYDTTNDSKGYNVSKGGSSNDQGKGSRTKEYMAAHCKKWMDKNREKAREISKAYYERTKDERKKKYDKEKTREYNQEYYKKNKEKSNEQSREYYHSHKEEMTEQRKKWEQKFKEEHGCSYSTWRQRQKKESNTDNDGV